MTPTFGRWAGGALALLVGCGGGQAGVDRALQRMQDQPRADAYASSDFFADGKVMQEPPAGTVPRERVLDPAFATGRDTGGAYLQRIPVPATPEFLARGRSRYQIFCAACHGAGGYGGSVVASNFTPPRPPPLRSGAAAALPPGLVYETIHGGFGRMPSYAGDLTVADRWAVVAYVRSIRGRAAADPEEQDDSARADALHALDTGTGR